MQDDKVESHPAPHSVIVGTYRDSPYTVVGWSMRQGIGRSEQVLVELGDGWGFNLCVMAAVGG